MSYLVLARKWRPQIFADVIGQNHVTRTLSNAIEQDRIAHAYIFTGPRGVGKTSIARILAKSLNCEQGPTVSPCDQCESCRTILDGNNFDVIEIDGASNNSVNDIRDLRANIQYGPSRFRYKIYIIDEVHMLSTGAFNALLKTLEEPPPHTVFIFATTEIHKVPLTILSRCQRFDFHRIPVNEISHRLRHIVDQENIHIDDDSLLLIARQADGGMRDAQSILDQLISFSGSEISRDQVITTLGLIDQSLYPNLQKHLLAEDGAALLNLVDQLFQRGHDPYEFLVGMGEHFRNLLTIGLTGRTDLLDLPAETAAEYQALSEQVHEGDLLRMLDLVTSQLGPMKQTRNPRLLLELLLIKLVRMDRTVDIQELLESGSGGSGAGAGPFKTPGSGAGATRNHPGRQVQTSAVKPVAPAERRPAPEQKSEPAPKPENPGMPVDTVRQGWKQFTDRVAADRPSLAVYLRQSVPGDLQNKTLVLRVPQDTPIVEQYVSRYREEVEQLIRSHFQCQCTLKLSRDKVRRDEQLISRDQVQLNDADRWETARRQDQDLQTLADRFQLRLI